MPAIAVIKKKIVARCNNAVARAAVLYPHISFAGIEVHFDLKGACAGQARKDYDVYSMRFNLEYAEHDLQILLEDTVPHEVAHIARFKDGKGPAHNAGWKKLCIELGGTGQTTHSAPKVYSKGKTYEYITTTGVIVRVSEHMHIKICNGALYRYSKAEGDIHSKCVWMVV